VLRPGKRILGTGSSGDQVRAVQARLKQIGWYYADVTGTYGTVTTASVKGFQAKRKIPVTGEIDRRTLDRLVAMTRTPTSDELHNISTSSASTSARLDSRCTTGSALCIDKTTRTLRYVVDGKVRSTYAVRFGASYSPTREGLFHVYWKDADHISKLYGSAMPYSMFFSNGQAVHYSSDFAARGYYGASHGCVNVRDFNGIRWLFSQVNVGDKVVVYWS
jgi:peptidoglycan hydrolase-like protein with peptidoglycan-binding domain